MEYYNEIKISILRIIKNETEHSKNEQFEVVYKNGIYILMNNFKKFEESKKKNAYIDVKIIGDIAEIDRHLTYRLTKEKLNPIENALLSSEYEQIHNLSLKQVAQRLNKTEGDLSNKRRLLKLPIYIQSDIINNTLKERHGRAILQLVSNNKEDRIKEVYQEIKINKLNVSDSEKYISKVLGKKENKKANNDSNLLEVLDKREFSNKLAIPAINQIENDLNGSLDLITKHYPHLEITKEEGVSNRDYVIKIRIKNVK